MDSIDRIPPIAGVAQTVHLRVAEANKDGRQKPGGEDEEAPRQEPHDVLELHGEDVVPEPAEPTEPPEAPTFGLDLAV